MERVGIADLKAHLSEHLRKVRAGSALTVMDRGTPVATIVPLPPGFERLTIRPPRQAVALRDLPLPPPLPARLGLPDIVELLLRERQTDR